MEHNIINHALESGQACTCFDEVETNFKMDPQERIKKYAIVNKTAGNNGVKYDPRPGDLVVMGPMKSGTTWMQQILHQIRTKGDENFEDIYAVTWWIPHAYTESDVDLNGEQVTNPRIYKSHEKYDMVPKCDGTKFIVIFRDPYDCEWSYIKFYFRFFGSDDDLNEEAALDMFQGRTKTSVDYFNALTSWYPHRNDPNVLWIHFEDLKCDLPFCIQKIAQFMQIGLSDQEFARVSHLCSFEYMSKNEKRFSGDPVMASIAKGIKEERWDVNCGMVRKDGGKMGEGRRSIGPKLKEAIDQRWDETVAKKLGYKDYGALLKETSFLKRFLKD